MSKDRVFGYDDLFRATSDEVVKVGDKEVKFYLRGLSSTEKDRRHKFAVRAARDMRQKLSNESSEEYELEMALVYSETSKEILIDSLASAHEEVAWADARVKVVRKDYPEPPDNADISDMIEIEDEEDRIEEELFDKRREFVEERVKNYRTELADLSVEELREMYAKVRVDSICYQAYMDSSTRSTLFYSVFRDKGRKNRFFENVQHVDEISSSIRDRLRDAYYALDKWSSEDLKN